MCQVGSKTALGPLEGQVYMFMPIPLVMSSAPLLCQWHRMPTTQETDGFQVKRPGDLNVKCTLLLMLDHQVTCPGAMSRGPGCSSWKPFQSLPYSCALIFHKNPSSDSLLAIPSLPSTSWTPDWQGCWECTPRRGPPSCRPCGFTSNTTSCRTGTSASTSTATVTSARLAGSLSPLWS